MKTNQTCQTCGVIFQALQTEINRGWGKYCGVPCRQKGNARQLRTPEGWHYRQAHFKATRDKHKVACRRKTRAAIKSGALVPEPCDHCGADKVEAHHEDYTLPLDVTWLCRRCHNLHHARERIAAAYIASTATLKQFGSVFNI